MSTLRHAWWPVARWEFVRIVSRADYWVSLLVTPLLLVGASLLARHRAEARRPTITVERLDARGRARPLAIDRLPGPGEFRWTVGEAPRSEGPQALALMRERHLDAAVVLHEDDHGVLSDVDVLVRRGRPDWLPRLSGLLDRAALLERAARFGANPESLALRAAPLEVRVRATTGATGARRTQFLATLGVLAFFLFVILVSLSYLMVGISGEKTARVTEVVVSAIPAQAWMDGKVVGLTGVGLLTGLAWAVAVILNSGLLGIAFLSGGIAPGKLGIALFFAGGGLVFYNNFVAALLASARDLQAASKWQGSVVLLPFAPLLFIRPLIDQPDGLLMSLLSVLPFFSPILIPARALLGGVRLWEVVLAAVVLVAACAFMRRAAGRIFRLGMLMYGKDMNLPELLRWARVK